MRRWERRVSRGGRIAAGQTELALAVPVCAWCRPGELGAGLGALSHGICPKHLRELGASLDSGSENAPPHRGRSRKVRDSLEGLAQLSFGFAASIAAVSSLGA